MKKLLLGGSMMAMAFVVSAQGKLTDVNWSKVGEGLKVEVQGENLTQPKILRVMGGKSYMLEFDAHLVGKAKRQSVNYGGVQFVQSGWFSAKPAKVRVHLRLDSQDAKIKVDETPAGWQVLVNAEATEVFALNKVPTGGEPVLKLAGVTLPEKTTAKALLGAEEPDGNPKEPKAKPAQAAAKAPAVKAAPMKVATKVEYAPVITELPAVNSYVQAGRRTVTLDMVNADIVQILKALAMQGNVNIVTSPEVKGNLTVSLTNVSVEEALNLVTTLAGVKYAKSGSTYVVAASSERLKAFPRVEDGSETRVVPIYSGEGTQIKATVLKVVPMDGAGSFEIMLPSEETTIEQTSAVGAATTGGKTEGGTGQATSVETKTSKEKVKDNYVVLIGPKSRLNALERTVKAIDEQICAAMGLDVPTSSAIMRTTYLPKGTTAVNLLKTVAGSSYSASSANAAKIGSVEIVATPEQSIGEQALTLKGRENEVNDLLGMLRALDSVASGDGEYMMYEVRHLDPRSLREDLVAQFPGLQVTILPGAASNPALAADKSQYKQSAEYKNDPNAQKAGSERGNGGGEQGGSQGKTTELLTPDNGSDWGLGLPFRKIEPFAFPMKIMLRGSKEKIDNALKYLKVIDTAPKQIAIEMRVMDLRKEDALKVGLDWSLLTGGSLQSIRVNQSVGGTAGTAGNVSGALGFAGGGALNVLSSLDALATDSNLIARPNLLGVDGRQTEMFVGDIIRYIESIQSTQTGITVTTKELPVGVRLAILPRVGGDGEITLDMRPMVSTLTAFTDVPGGGQLPQTSLRIAQSTMNIKSGETIAIGGLIQDSDTISEGGIPILKDLPIIGKLFSRTTKNKRKSEIVFFVTAKVVDADSRAKAAQPTRDEAKKEGN